MEAVTEGTVFEDILTIEQNHKLQLEAARSAAH